MKPTVLITGASHGIGKAAALKFAQEGYYVYLNCHSSVTDLKNVAAEIEAFAPSSCTLLTGDVSSSADVKRMFEEISVRSGGVDVLVNNAGTAHIGLLMDMSDDEWNHIIQTDLSSVFYCTRAALPYMVHKKSGHIINISSMWGTVGASCEVAYSAAKSGIHGFTRALAKEMAPGNIQVNALACGCIDTRMNSQLSTEEKAALCEEIPAGRFGTPEEVADMIFSLSTAPSYLTGQIIGIDGGYI